MGVDALFGSLSLKTLNSIMLHVFQTTYVKKFNFQLEILLNIYSYIDFAADAPCMHMSRNFVLQQKVPLTLTDNVARNFLLWRSLISEI